jgi:hypothetical protein
MKITFFDRLVYRLFYWRWNPILRRRADLLEVFRRSLDRYVRNDDEVRS